MAKKDEPETKPSETQGTENTVDTNAGDDAVQGTVANADTSDAPDDVKE